MSNYSFLAPSDFRCETTEKKVEVRCKIVGFPRPMQRPRISRKINGHFYSPSKVHVNSFVQATMNAINSSTAAHQFDLNDPSKPVAIVVNFYFARPKNHFRESKLDMELRVPKNAPHFVTKKPDIDNLVKLVLDALQNLFHSDDKSIAHICAKKIWMEKPGEKFVPEKTVGGCTIFQIIQHKNNSCDNF